MGSLVMPRGCGWCWCGLFSQIHPLSPSPAARNNFSPPASTPISCTGDFQGQIFLTFQTKSEPERGKLSLLTSADSLLEKECAWVRQPWEWGHSPSGMFNTCARPREREHLNPNFISILSPQTLRDVLISEPGPTRECPNKQEMLGKP